ncbi:MAG: PEP-CTERM system TPR-repeat protein PrsT [Alphaproteobacteria bacterium]|nr:PEP-CTERM system TPR-repeat protein PrsT [Alphaproteobacteria bacterium]MDX5369045.1 PEP-CTERM system TPR-repeat protein PrsT [Alphaproteobacteria bacterium]MDX5463749.1 PEP-CTERM system TPR-repeat protein PrsT [Alphaproteobacteria bacterium]
MTDHSSLTRRPLRAATLALAALLATTTLTPALAAIDENSVRYYQEALEEVEKGNIDAAIIQLRNALQRDADNLDARQLLGKLQLQRGDAVSAEKELSRVIEKRPTDEAEALLGRALLAQGRYEETIRRVTPDGLDTKATIEKHAVLGEAYLAKQDFAKAEELYNRIVELDPKSVQGQYGLARVYTLSRQIQKAERQIDELLRDHPEHGPAWMVRGELAMAKEDRHMALFSFNKAIELMPRDINGYIARARAYLMNNQIKEARADANRVIELRPNNALGYYLLSAAAFAEGDTTAADQAYIRVAEQLRDFPPALLLGALIKFKVGDFAQSEQLMTRYVNSEPGNMAARRALAIVRLRIDSPQSAIDLLEPIVQESPTDVASMQALASAYTRVGQYDKADAMYRRIREVGRPQDIRRAEAAQMLLCEGGELSAAAAEACSGLLRDDLGKDILLVLDFVNTGDLDRALTEAEKLLSANPDSELVMQTLAGVHIARKDTDKAREVLNTALEKNPDFTSAADLLEGLDKREGTTDRIPQRLERLIERSPENPALAVRLARNYAETGQGAKAAAFLADNLSRYDRSIQYREAMVRVNLAENNPAAARQAVAGLVSLRPDDVDVLRFALNAYILTDNLDKAIEMGRELVEVAPDDTQHPLALAQLQVRNRDFDGALATMRKARAAAPRDSELARTEASIHLLKNDMEGALDVARSFQSVSFPDGKEMEASLLARQGRIEDGILLLENALIEQPQSQLATALYRARRQAGRTEEAIEGLKSWLGDNPNDRGATTVLAAGLLETGSFRDAERLYQALLIEDPRNAVLLNNMAWVRGQLRRPDAIDYAERAYMLRPDSALIADTYGWLLLQRDKVKEGLNILEVAAKAAPDNVEIQAHYGIALSRAGQKEKAIEVLEAALDDGADFTERKLAEETLRRLKAG